MLSFECTLANSGGALILTVTCDSDFAGQTIACTDGTTTLTQTCPSSSPYTVEFKIPNAGIWTVSCGTDSTTITIPDTVTLHMIPTGATVTPTDDIQTWLHCANIWDKTYTTISQVLGDGTTVTALIASNNAADYMARSTTWASSVVANSSAMTKIGNNNYCSNALLSNSTWLNAICNSTNFEKVLKVKVPTMTSNTTPSGECIATSYYNSTLAPWKAFDKVTTDTNSCWCSGANSTTNQRLGYHFTSSLACRLVKWVSRYGQSYSAAPKNYKIQGSNDGSTWVTLGTFVNNDNNPNIEHTNIINNQTNYSYYCLFAVDKNSDGFNYIAVGELQFYGRAA